MNGHTVTVVIGATLLVDGDPVEVVEFDGRSVMVRTLGDGAYRSLNLAELASRARGLGAGPAEGDDPGLVLAGLSAAEQEKVAARAGHVREVLTGFTSGHAESARTGEPRPQFAPGVALKEKYAAKAAELKVSVRTVENWTSAYRACGEAALVDDRKRVGHRRSVDPRWDAAVLAELAAGVDASTPTRSAVLMRAAERLEREHGEGVVGIPPKTTAYRRLEELTKGRNAVSGSAKGRRSIASRPQGTYGRLRATRPGEYLILDTQDLDMFAMEPVTCRWLRAQLTVAQDLFDRQILGLRVTPVSTKAVDVAGVLFEAITGRSGGRAALGSPHGVPQRLVFTEHEAEESWCLPETLVVDHGKAFLSAHVIGVCARLGISIQPAQPKKPTDKPTVERFFKTLREGLIQHLPAYKGPDLHSRGIGLEGKAFLFLHELEDVIRDWIITVHHTDKHDGLTIPEWPGLPLSPNEMFTLGVGKAGRLRLPARPELALEFHRVAWRTVQHYGVEVNGLLYNGTALDGHRNQTSPYGGIQAGKWPIRVNDEDVRSVYFQEPADGSWHQLDWEHAPMLGTAFSAEAAQYARALAAQKDRFADPVAALKQVLQRWESGQVMDRRERRMAARLSAERSGIPLPSSPQDGDPAVLPAQAGPQLVGDDDSEDELFDDTEGYYDDALEVLE
ncbi:integrase [Kitasatospora sp. NPDC088779]|uniref:integrase n=1 Tax=unclassified Kitasatospora TaxID=2633591 RepID=UPI003449ED59